MEELEIHAADAVGCPDSSTREVPLHGGGVGKDQIGAPPRLRRARRLFQDRIEHPKRPGSLGAKEEFGIGREEHVPLLGGEPLESALLSPEGKPRFGRLRAGSGRGQERHGVSLPGPNAAEFQEAADAAIDAQMRQRDGDSEWLHAGAEFTLAGPRGVG